MRDEKIFDTLKLALDALVLVSKGHSERSAVARAAGRDQHRLSQSSRALAIVTATVSELDLLDRMIQQILPNVKISRESLALFRLASTLTSSKYSEPTVRLVEALRRIATNHNGILFERLLGSLIVFESRESVGTSTEVDQLSLQTHNPPWWVNYCIQQFGRQEALRILSFHDRPRYIRVNSLRNRGHTSIPPEAKRFFESGIQVGFGLYRLPESPIGLSRHFESGLFQVQDLASFLSVVAAEPVPGEKVLDLCAAPGGKTATLSQMMKNRGTIISVDYSETRMKAWSRETGRLGVRIATPLIEDSSNLGLTGEYDLVFLDPPCSGSGILDRNPGMKWHLSEKTVQKFSNLQFRMLEESSYYVRRGGRLLYCTCSLTLEENENLISRFLVHHPEFEDHRILREYGSPGLRGLANCRRFYPHKDQTAGYFVARLDRSM